MFMCGLWASKAALDIKSLNHDALGQSCHGDEEKLQVEVAECYFVFGSQLAKISYGYFQI